MKKFMGVFLCIFFLSGIALADTYLIGFEDLFLNGGSYWNGADGSGGFSSEGATFSNYYDSTYGVYWEGFSYSNMTDTSISGVDAQYNAITGEGAEGSSNYAVGYFSSFGVVLPTIIFSEEKTVTGAYFTNCNYTYYSMLNGDAFAKRFENGDWLKLTVKGLDVQGNVTGTVDFLLAEDTNIIDSWVWLNLSSLGVIKGIEFTMSSSDSGQWGMNTPAYFCMDNLTISTPSDKKDTQPYTLYPLIYPLTYPYLLNNYWGISPLEGYYGVPFAGRTIEGFSGINVSGSFLNPFTLNLYNGYPFNMLFSGYFSGFNKSYTDWYIRGYLRANPAGGYLDLYSLFGNSYGISSKGSFDTFGALSTFWPYNVYLGVDHMYSYFW
ncbi:DUF4465 domain-containing protein [bacterium]|nr:DUF4465 domain-containing protein [bacterium]